MFRMDKAKFKFKFYKACTVAGAFLIILPIGIQWFWGNLSIYVLSYYHNHGITGAEDKSTWVTSLLLISRGIFFIISGYSSRKFGPRITIAIGMIVFNLGIVCSYFALFSSPELLDFTLGVLCGVGAGLVYGPSIQCGIQWTDESNVGVVISIIQSGYPCGAVLVNQLVTMYLNPHNEVPTVSENRNFSFFSESSMLQKTPSIFLILATFFIVVQLLGLSLIRDRTDESESKVESKRLADSSAQNGTTYSTNVVPDDTTDAETCPHNYTPKEMFHSLTFYLLALTSILTDYSYLIVVNYYKAFGQLWIRDDHFLTFIGTAMSILNVPVKITFGILVDEIGVKNTLVFGFSLISVSCAFMHIGAMVHKWMYWATATMLASLTGAIGNVFYCAPVIFFGRKYSIMNIGWLTLVSLLGMVISPLIMEPLVSAGKWSSLFFSGAGSELFALLITVWFFANV